MTRCGDFLTNADFDKIVSIIIKSIDTHEAYTDHKKIIRDNKSYIIGSIEDELDNLFSNVIDDVMRVIDEEE